MKNLLLCFLCILINFSGIAQRKTSHLISDTTYTVVEQEGKQPYLLPTMQLILNRDQSNSSFALSSPEHRHHYHIMVLRLNPDVKLITMAELFTIYHIDKKYWRLPISSNKSDFVYKGTVMVSPDAIIDAKLTKRDDRNEYYINITTRDKPDPDAIN
jgi:hypothetical protein